MKVFDEKTVREKIEAGAYDVEGTSVTVGEGSAFMSVYVTVYLQGRTQEVELSIPIAQAKIAPSRRIKRGHY